MEPFDPKIHLFQDRRWNDKYLAYYAYNQIRWVLKAVRCPKPLSCVIGWLIIMTDERGILW
jgi:hypothetical protein